MGWVAVLEGNSVGAGAAVGGATEGAGLKARPTSCRGDRLKGFGGRLML